VIGEILHTLLKSENPAEKKNCLCFMERNRKQKKKNNNPRPHNLRHLEAENLR
jgi:hypothetical protein